MSLIERVVSGENGLPSDQVHVIDQDNFGRLWLAGPAGVSRYDGSHLASFDTSTGMECQGLRTVHISYTNQVWIGTDRGVELLTSEGKPIPLILDFEWKFGICEVVYLGKENIIWLGTSFGLIKTKHFPESSNLQFISVDEVGLVRSILPLPSGSVLVACAKYGMIEYVDTTWKVFNKTPLPDTQVVVCLDKTIDNIILAGTAAGLLIYDLNGYLTGEYIPDPLNKKVSSLLVLGDEWWASFGKKLIRLQARARGLVAIESLDVESRINHLFIDVAQNIWIGTNHRGVMKISCFRGAILKIEEAGSTSGFSIRESQSENTYQLCGDGYSGVFSFNESIPKHKYTPLFGLPKTIIWDSCQDPKNKERTFFATEDGLFIDDDGQEQKKPFNGTGDLIHSPCRALLARNNEVWLGTIAGLFKIQGDQVTEIRNEKGNKFGYVYTLDLGPENSIWVGTLGQGLWVEENNHFRHHTTSDISENGNIYCIRHNLHRGTLVVQEEKLILLKTPSISRILLTERPLAGWSVEWIDLNRIALGTNSGILIVDGESGSIIHRVQVYLPKSDWQFTCSRALLHCGNGILICGMNGGMFLVDVNKLSKLSIKPQLYLSGVQWKNAEVIHKNDTYYVSTGKWFASVSAFCDSFLEEKQLKFRFKLVGFDENWRPYRKVPEMRFNSLPPGKYELQAQVYSPLTGNSLTKTLLKLEVSGFKFVNRIMQGLNSITSTISTLFGSHQKNEVLLSKNNELENEIRERIKAESALNTYRDRLEEIVANRTHDLKLEKERAESADRMKSTFLATMSHEIRTPLGGVIGLNKLLESTELDEAQSEYVAKIKDSAHHLLQLINDILDITKIESGKMELDFHPFSLIEVIKYATNFGQVKLVSKDLEILIDHTLPRQMVKGDSLRLKQVLINLIGNAIKFTDSGMILIKVKELDSNEHQTTLEFNITDTGIGMTEDEVAKLFQAFMQADSSISRKFGGSGLGLNISKTFVQLMGGELKVRSEKGKGSTFYFVVTFPYALDEPIPQLLKLSTKVKSQRMLLIDDNPVSCEIFERLIQRINSDYLVQLTCEYVNSEQVALERIQAKAFDLIFVDHRLENTDGITTIEKIKQMKLGSPQPEMVLLTSFTDEHVLSQSISVGINKVLNKPMTTDDIVGALNTFFTKKKIHNPIKQQEKGSKYPEGFELITKSRILIAEDNMVNQLIIRKIMQNAGFEIVIASNGQKCVDILSEEGPFDLILMDIQMPEMDGITATKYIRNEIKNTTIPIIALTADVLMGTKESLISQGFNDYLSKPISEPVLYNSLLYWLTLNKG